MKKMKKLKLPSFKQKANSEARTNATKRSLVQSVKSPLGLSLIEMLVVIGLLAFLMSVVARNVSQSRKKSDVNKAKISMGIILQAMEEFNYDCGNYPESLEDLLTAPSDCEEWGPNSYLKNRKMLQDPWKQEFIYSYDEETDQFEILSYGADRRPGGSGPFNKDISSLDI